MEVINLSYRCGTCIYFDTEDKKGGECRCLLSNRKHPYRFRTDKCANYVEDTDKPKIVPRRRAKNKNFASNEKALNEAKVVMNEMKTIKKDILALAEEMNCITEAYLKKIKEVCEDE